MKLIVRKTLESLKEAFRSGKQPAPFQELSASERQEYAAWIMQRYSA